MLSTKLCSMRKVVKTKKNQARIFLEVKRKNQGLISNLIIKIESGKKKEKN